MITALDGKVALVTGAGGGIGLAAAEAFAKAGASVVVADRDEERVGKAAQSLCASGYNAIGVTCDVTDTAQVEAMIERHQRLWAARRSLQQCRREFRGCRVPGNQRQRI
jgi:NAD(P)-dependent dehydrogenase (short-subunit alcohol dehydrogenase family)